jgi:hypothetical protein
LLSPGNEEDFFLPQIYDDNWRCDCLFCIELKNELYISFRRATYFDTEMIHRITVLGEAAIMGTEHKEYDKLVIAEKRKFPLVLRITRLFNLFKSIPDPLSNYTQM